MNPEPDIAKVRAAVAAIEARRRRASKSKAPVQYPPSPAHDAAIRKPLKSHGIPCKGFNHHAFLNRDS